eukprot:TRINITY_DN19748_c0_g1_i1.p2 TRINITY_DN19748_c0_g1~~TRINITY_DN19748_c0_g1_i1.p2  ORF type:complete len:119 (-),score=3.40 TRINITY_DN19748_c0_g1_i1:533-889(-)
MLQRLGGREHGKVSSYGQHKIKCIDFQIGTRCQSISVRWSLNIENLKRFVTRSSFPRVRKRECTAIPAHEPMMPVMVSPRQKFEAETAIDRVGNVDNLPITIPAVAPWQELVPPETIT